MGVDTSSSSGREACPAPPVDSCCRCAYVLISERMNVNAHTVASVPGHMLCQSHFDFHFLHFHLLHSSAADNCTGKAVVVVSRSCELPGQWMYQHHYLRGNVVLAATLLMEIAPQRVAGTAVYLRMALVSIFLGVEADRASTAVPVPVLGLGLDVDAVAVVVVAVASVVFPAAPSARKG